MPICDCFASKKTFPSGNTPQLLPHSSLHFFPESEKRYIFIHIAETIKGLWNTAIACLVIIIKSFLIVCSDIMSAFLINLSKFLKTYPKKTRAYLFPLLACS
jgi:hypothetical protein